MRPLKWRKASRPTRHHYTMSFCDYTDLERYEEPKAPTLPPYLLPLEELPADQREATRAFRAAEYERLERRTSGYTGD